MKQNISNSFDEILLLQVLKNIDSAGKLPVLAALSCAASAVNADAGSIWLVSGAVLQRTVIINRPVELLNSFTVHLDEDEPLAKVVRTLQPFRTVDAHFEKNLKAPQVVEAENLKAALFSPIILNHSCVGVITLFRKRAAAFSDHDLEMVTFVSNLLTLYIDGYMTNSDQAKKWCEVFDYISKICDNTTLSLSHEMPNPIWLTYKNLPKGILPETLMKIESELQSTHQPITTQELSAALNISCTTIRRYLNYLYEIGVVIRDVEYQIAGRPEYIYTFRNNVIVGM